MGEFTQIRNMFCLFYKQYAAVSEKTHASEDSWRSRAFYPVPNVLDIISKIYCDV